MKHHPNKLLGMGMAGIVIKRIFRGENSGYRGEKNMVGRKSD